MPMTMGTCALFTRSLEFQCADGAANPPDWCSKKWCYVDPCTCKGFATAASDYFPGTDTFFSYAVCGESDTFSDFGACGEHVEEDVCTESVGCLWDKRFAQCFEAPVLTA